MSLQYELTNFHYWDGVTYASVTLLLKTFGDASAERIQEAVRHGVLRKRTVRVTAECPDFGRSFTVYAVEDVKSLLQQAGGGTF